MTDNIKAKGEELIQQYKGVLVYGQRRWGQNYFATQCAIIAVERELKTLDQLHQNLNHNTYAAIIIKEQFDESNEVLNYLKSKQ